MEYHGLHIVEGNEGASRTDAEEALGQGRVVQLHQDCSRVEVTPVRQGYLVECQDCDFVVIVENETEEGKDGRDIETALDEAENHLNEHRC